MSVLEGVLKEELERIQRNIASYESLLASLPKGYLFEQRLKSKIYCYRKRREGDKIVSEYVGPIGSAEAKKAVEDYEQRKRIDKNLRMMRKEEARLVKALRHYGD
ncbi:MAG: hypothetical protein IKQ34_04580 [Bacilli bacterium]|nr:hypothetical protein [Bacilli bacterium]MBR6056052.1 hypothetical protein [Bacilli bacterium]